MKKDTFFKFLYLLTALVVVINTVLRVSKSVFSDINDLPEGRLETTAVSPDGKKTINIYLISNAVGNAVRGELKEGDKTHNIFWQTGITDTDAVWLNNDEIMINHMPINITLGGDYDCRRGTSLFQEGALYEMTEPEKNK